MLSEVYKQLETKYYEEQIVLNEMSNEYENKI